MRTRAFVAAIVSALLVAGCGSTATAPPAATSSGTAPTSAPTSMAPITPTPNRSLPVLQGVVDAPTVIDVPASVVSETVVTSAGGTISAEGVTVAVPAGGVSSDTKVVVSRLEAPFEMNVFAPVTSTDPAAMAIGKSYDLGPSGTTFAQPVDITLAYDPAFVPAGTDPATIGVAYYTGTHWAVAGGAVDPAAHTVTVRVQKLEGELFTTILVATAAGLLINKGIRWYYGGDGVKSDPISEKNASKWITPDDPTVRKVAASAKVKGVPASDPEKLADFLKNHKGGSVPITIAGPDGKPMTLGGRYSTAGNANWQKPADYLTTGDMRGDCTDVTNALVSAFRALGYPARGVFGYVVDKESPHAWGEVVIGGKPYFIDEEGTLQPLDQAVTSMHLILPDASDPRAFAWDETGQAPYTPEWWNEKIDVNGKWAGTFTVTAVSIDPAMRAEAEKQAADQGCDLTDALEQLVGKAVPMTLDLTVGEDGKGTATVFIDYSVIKDAKGKPLASKPSTADVTYVGDRITFVGEGVSGSMTGTVSRTGDTSTIRGTTKVSGEGFTMTGVWSVGRNGQ